MTAPPEDSAVNKKISTVLNDVTSDTPETSASLEKLTTNVSAMPTNISKNCSINSGMIKFRRSLFVNILRLEFLRKSVPAVCQHPFHLCHIPVAEIRRYHGGNSMGVHPQLIV